MKLAAIVLITLALVTPQAGAAGDDDAATDAVRISLAISGGASKGAYEAGLTWGVIEVLRQKQNAPYWPIGGLPRPVEISSIAGTSAGGINTLLAALTWAVKPEDDGGFANHIDDNILRRVWLTPDVNRLLPPAPDAALYAADDALLARKDLVDVAREVRKEWNRPGAFRKGVRLPLGVTVTRVKPAAIDISGVTVVNQRFFIPFELRTRENGSTMFMFNPDDYPYLNDPAMLLMPWAEDQPPFSISDHQIEEALLSTSAFPGGFGRRRLHYCNRKAAAGEALEGPAVSSRPKPEMTAALICPDGYELNEAEFADGGLFDNLPLGLSRSLSETSARHKKTRLPIRYIYLDPNRTRFTEATPESKSACDEENPPDACRQMTFDIGSEMAVLGRAIGTARTNELYREMTGDNWRLNLSALSREMADTLDARHPGVGCDERLPFFEGSPRCSDRLRQTGRLLTHAYGYRFVPIIDPMSAAALEASGVSGTCRTSPVKDNPAARVECPIDPSKLRKTLAEALTHLAATYDPDNDYLKADLRDAAQSGDADRLLLVTSRGGPITGTLLGDFGAFLDYKFREYDYHVGVYDAVILVAGNQCARNYADTERNAEFDACLDRLSQRLYDATGISSNPKSRYLFARMAQREFGDRGGLRYAYAPMPPEDRDTRIIFEGLSKPYDAVLKKYDNYEELISVEREFFEHLKAEGFEPSPTPDGQESLLIKIMDDPEFWSYELVNRATGRWVHLEKQAEAVYKAREPDPDKREKANTGLMGTAALALRTATYKPPAFTFSPSTSPNYWFWRYAIPYEAALDISKGDILALWQPTWGLEKATIGIRLGLGFTGGLFSSNKDENRNNYGVIGLDLTRLTDWPILSGWGLTPSVYHQWKTPETGDQTTFGIDIHTNLLKDRLRFSLGCRDVVENAGDTVFLTIGLTDVPGLIYWLGGFAE
jgi:hypothetical protein